MCIFVRKNWRLDRLDCLFPKIIIGHKMSHEENSFIKLDTPIENLTETTSLKWKDSSRQITASLIALAICIPAGINLSFSSILLPQLYGSDDIPITKSEASWIASLVTISLPIGTVLTGVLMDKCGRKKANIFATIPFAVAWIVTATAQNVETIYCARLLAGIASGLTTTATIYISEVTHPNFRPMLLGLVSVYVSFGILLTCLLGYWCHWRTMCYIFFLLEIILFGLLFLVPESPYWLAVFKKDTIGASKSLKWIYQNPETLNSESRRFFSVEIKKQFVQKRFRLSSYFTPIVYKPFIILAVLFVIQQLTGAYVIIFYAMDIFTRISHISKSTDNEQIALVLLGVIRFVTSVISALVSKKVGRKPLLLVSGAGMCGFSLITAIYLYLKDGTERYDQYVPLICILSYVCMGSIGYLLIPWTLIGELLPIEARGKLGSFLVGLAYIYMFGVLKAFPYLLDVVSLSTIFCIFAIVNIIGICFVQYFLPETLGKRFSEIEKNFV
ncbi:hypothetical protein RN001_010315 [Aquatica leii]|uniref:Major facilitator superfamily (MFS) profile domain-containing protein n=1 Tax=Aquatica leii TaxID=1421715 RepID=A0AAN7P6A4_9COLE|nr:hypothetical protein RN001_010315 [Aquatica leii]